MKTPIVAAVILFSSISAAMAGVGPANSTNQHLRDSADFYDSVPDFRTLSSDRSTSSTVDVQLQTERDTRAK
ncbi:MAG: hypothetical protein DI534_16070 [Leifsonia xyli]|nr:MAG: hypothetical protein DI534_16070 [Leifsonia xyli]